MYILAVFLLLPQQVSPTQLVLDNPYVQVNSNAAPCATAKSSCGDRVIVGGGRGGFRGNQMGRGEIAVIPAGDASPPPEGHDYLEVALKPGHPPVKSPPVMIAPEKNSVLYDGDHLFIFEEKLDPAETRGR